jgi:hypothetical protein
MIAGFLKNRKEAALQELARLIKEKNAFPINYNHYYTDNVQKKRGKRIGEQIGEIIPAIPDRSTVHNIPCENHPESTHHVELPSYGKDDLKQAVSRWAENVSADMEEFGCLESMDCLEAIYRVRGTGTAFSGPVSCKD